MRRTIVATAVAVAITLLGVPFGAAEAADDAKEFTNLVGMKCRLIPAGSFLMGSVKEADEQPIRKVNISKPFYMGVTEVTQAQYEKVMGVNPSQRKKAGCPVESVSWGDAQAFCKKLSETDKTGTYRLPTEAEWEYACRAGTRTTYFWGDKFDGKFAWMRLTSDETLQPAGKLKPNPWGLYDMIGNVWEWCQDWYARPYMPGEQTDPPGPPEGKERVMRGGSWWTMKSSLTSANRKSGMPQRKEGDIGFRVVYVPNK